MKRILIDTDVILDFFFDRKPFSNDSAAVLSLCEAGAIKGFVTSVIISNVYYILRQNSTHANVVEKLLQLSLIMDFLTSGREVILKALNSGFKDFEDALQNYSAEAAGQIDVIITRNVKGYKKSLLGVMTPHDYLKALGLAI